MTTLQIGAIEVIDLREHYNGSYKWRELQAIERLIIHHSGVNVDSNAEAIHNYHKSLGWPGIGYHFLVHQEGTTEYAGDILTTRYHAREYNPTSIGIILPGNWNEERPPDIQIEAAKALCANLQLALGWHIPIFGHRELMATSCPGDTAVGTDGWLAYIREDLGG